MEQAVAISTIKARFDSMWASLHNDIGVKWVNAISSQPPVYPFVHASIRFGIADKAGWSVQRQSGEVLLRIFVEAGTEDTVINDLCDEAAGIFRFWRSDGLVFFASAPLDDGDDVQDGNFYQRDVIASFMLDLLE